MRHQRKLAGAADFSFNIHGEQIVAPIAKIRMQFPRGA